MAGVTTSGTGGPPAPLRCQPTLPCPSCARVGHGRAKDGLSVVQLYASSYFLAVRVWARLSASPAAAHRMIMQLACATASG